jgi:polyhydroxyalkanoate synthase
VASGEPVSLTDIRVPIFAVGTERDHVAPWRSTYKINLQTETEVTYLLTTGGHNVGIVSEMGYAGERSFQVRKHGPKDHYLDPDRFLVEAPQKEGSWWPEWARWLEEHSGALTAPPPMGARQAGLPVIGDAPGSYVLHQ